MKTVAAPATIALAKLRWIGRSLLSLTSSLPDFSAFSYYGDERLNEPLTALKPA
jgi:hypothetical protein